MAASAAEQFASRVVVDSTTSDVSPSVETMWHIFGASDEIEAYTALTTVPVPAIYTTPSGRICYLETVEMKDVFESSDALRLTHSANCKYVYKKPDDQVDYEFEAGSQTVTLTNALETLAYTGGGRTAPDFRSGINVSSEGKIQGIDIEQPKFSFSLTISWPKAMITRAYQLTVSSMVGTTNNATYFDLPRGSVKFLGGRGRTQGARFPITYQFEFSRPEGAFTVGDVSIPGREGWWYTDIFRASIADASAGKKVEFPHSVYLHRVYPYTDFAALGLGTG